jgi:heme a synthase
MSLDEFKVIYWWEWGHRQLGRLIGLVWAVGFLWFLARRADSAGLDRAAADPRRARRVQGAIGWWMVSSGLEGQMVSVASYRLATHLGLAFVILGLIAWYVFLLGRTEAQLLAARRAREGRLFSMSTGLMHFAFLQILIGALVAGIDAGRNFTDWPLMAGGFFPPAPFELTPLWRNFFEDDGLVQFMHRMAGYLLFAFGDRRLAARARSPNPATRLALNAVGRSDVASGRARDRDGALGAPVQIAIVHQLGAVLLWVAHPARALPRPVSPDRRSVRG